MVDNTVVTEVARPRVADSPQGKVPLYTSRPQAGFPSPGDAEVERVLDINDLVVRHPASTFFVRVSGDSMEGAGIFDADVLVVDRAVEATVGVIVVAAVNGELVVKRLGRQGDTLVLLSENPLYAPIMVREEEECYIWGTVVGSVRVF